MSRWCSDCHKAYYREYNRTKRYGTYEAGERERARGRDKYRNVLKPARMALKLRLVLALGGKCAICGYARNLAALDFDHLEPATKDHTVSHLLYSADPRAYDNALKESRKCQLICSNCHREKTYPDWAMPAKKRYGVPE